MNYIRRDSQGRGTPRRGLLLGGFVGILLLIGLLALPLTAGAAGSVTVSPQSGAAGTTFTITGSGFTAGPVVVTVKGPNNNTTGTKDVTVGASGQINLTYDSSGDDPGTYTVLVAGGAGTQGSLLAQATFTVTPGVPNTGGGYAASTQGFPGTLLVGFGLGALALCFGLWQMRRRHAA